MAEVPGRNLTIADIQKHLTPKGDVARRVRILAQSTELEGYRTFKECNKQDTHTETIETGLPTLVYVMANQGSPTSKGTVAQFTFGTSIMEGRSHIHRHVVTNAKTRPGIRMQQADMFAAAAGQQDERTTFYGNPATNPQEYIGLSTYYSSLAADNAQNIIDAGGTTNLCSMWLLGIGDEGIFWLYPEGMAQSVGLNREDQGLITIPDPNGAAGTYMEVWSELFTLHRGICVKNWQMGVRIANIDTTALIATTGTQAVAAGTALLKLMVRAYEKRPKVNRDAVKWIWVANRVCHTGLMLMAMERQVNVLNYEAGVNSAKVSAYGIPIVCADQLLNSEGRVT